MRVPISWLKEYVEVSLPINELAEKLTLAGLEVEKIEYVGLPGSELPWDRDKIVVAQVQAVERHPNADKLLLVDLAYGEDRTIKVVTGAPNLKPGDKEMKVVLALKGSWLYDGHKEGKVITVLKEATLRGIKNDSMVCSEKELGISEEHNGIILLPDDAPVGMPLVDYWGDAVLEIAILPNTIRCAGVLGVAREVAAITGHPLRYPPMNFVEDDPENTADLVRLEIRDWRLNPRFTAGMIKNVKQAPSPMWMQRRLKLAGVRAINNVVDVSNYVMLELGHPTHTFDYDRIRAKSQEPRAKLIYTRTAEPGEKLITLDGKERELLPSDILVCDELGGVSLAGVMGGATSEVEDDTKNVLFEVASWHNISIRKTARHHDLPSEASFRFSRGLHPAQAMLAQKRGLYLLQQLTGGTVTKGIVDAYPQPLLPTTIDLDPNYVRRIVGMEIPDEEMARILRSLEFEVIQTADGGRRTSDVVRRPSSIVLHVTSPDHRTDIGIGIEGQHDLAEEIGRIYGYDKLPVTLMADEMPPVHGNPQLEFEERIKDTLMNAGLSEIISYRMTTPEQEAKLFVPGTPADDRPYVSLLNPINPERSAMRHSLLGGALEALGTNVRHHKQVKLFEVGSVYLPSEGSDDGNGAGLPDEPARLVVVMSGTKEPLTWSVETQRLGSRGASLRAMDFFDVKGAAETLLKDLNIEASYEAIEHPSFYPGRTAAVSSAGKDGQRLGVLGELHPRVREAWGLPDQPVLVADFDVTALKAASSRGSLIRDVPRFPSVEEDLALIVNEDVKASDVEAAIARAGGNLLNRVSLFDVYRGEQLGAGKKSLAYSLSYQAEDRTLSDKDIEKIRSKIIRSLEATLGATIRK